MSGFTDSMLEDGFTDPEEYLVYLERKSMLRDIEINDDIYRNSEGGWDEES